jgi:phosphate transport system permease protein
MPSTNDKIVPLSNAVTGPPRAASTSTQRPQFQVGRPNAPAPRSGNGASRSTDDVSTHSTVSEPDSRPEPLTLNVVNSPAAQRDPSRFAPRIRQRRITAKVFAVVCLVATLIGVVVLAALLVDLFRDGAARLSFDMITGFPSRFPDRAGIGPAVAGSAWVLFLTAIIAFPLGVGTAIWLEEYAADNRWKRLIEMNIANLAGVPSIVYGILGLTLFVRVMGLGRSLMAAALTLALLILPVIIIASQEALKAVPRSIRLGAYALGATRWETIQHQILPMAMPGVMTGTILALSRAIGEAAPVILVGALGFVAFIPTNPSDQYTVLPFQIFNWVSRPQPAFHEVAAAASLVLLALLLSMSGIAIWLRNKYTRRS